jgi:opacity protein-like surface antigen
MRKLLLTPVFVALTADNSFAADLPAKAPGYYKATPAYFTWTGCYLGGNAGAASARAKFTTTFDPGTHLGPANSDL